MQSSSQSKKECNKIKRKKFDEFIYYEEEQKFCEMTAEAFNSDIEDDDFFNFVMEQNYQNYLKNKESENVIPVMRTFTFNATITMTVNISLQEDRKNNYIRF